MGSTPTNRLSLTLDDGNEFINPQNPDFTRIDAAMPAILVNDGVVPADSALYDGAIVAERTSGKVWMAVKNVGGTFDHVWIRYPYTAVAINDVDPYGSGGSYSNRPPLTFSATWSKNASASSFSGTTGFTVPVTGVWSFRTHFRWGQNANGRRGGMYKINDVSQNNETETMVAADAGYDTEVNFFMQRPFVAGDAVNHMGFQDSGSVINLYQIMTCTLLYPTL